MKNFKKFKYKNKIITQSLRNPEINHKKTIKNNK